MKKCKINFEKILNKPPKGAKKLLDYVTSKESNNILTTFRNTGSRFGFLAKTTEIYKRFDSNTEMPIIRKNKIAVFFTQETLDRDIKFIENYPLYTQSEFHKIKRESFIHRLKLLRNKAFMSYEFIIE